MRLSFKQSNSLRADLINYSSSVTTSLMESGSSWFFVSGRINVRRPPSAALTAKKIFGRFGFTIVISLVNGANIPPTRARMTQKPMQLDRMMVGKISDAYTNKAVKAQLIPKSPFNRL